jgi:hypothetical protein
VGRGPRANAPRTARRAAARDAQCERAERVSLRLVPKDEDDSLIPVAVCKRLKIPCPVLDWRPNDADRSTAEGLK